MSYLLDTNVLSELRKRAPNIGLADWMEQRPASTLYLSVLTLGELRKGIEGVSEGRRRTQMLDWLEVDLPTFFTGRILAIDAHVADRWGRLLESAGRPVPASDSLRLETVC